MYSKIAEKNTDFFQFLFKFSFLKGRTAPSELNDLDPKGPIMIKFILSLLLVNSLGVFAQEISQPVKPPMNEDRFDRPPGPIECFEELKYCTYLIQNIDKASTLINQVLPILFPNGIIDFDKGHMKQAGNNSNKVSFWYEDEVILGRMKALLMRLDSLEQFSPSVLIEVNTEVYAVTEEALSEMRAEISGITFGQGTGTTPTISSGDNGLSFSMNVGTATLSALIGMQRAKGTATRISSVTQIIQNLDSLNYSQVTPIYLPQTGTGVVKEGESGIKINGTVTVNKENNELVGIKNYSFSYAVQDPKNPGLVTTLKMGSSNMYLEEGVSFALVSANTEASIAESNIRLISGGRRTSKVNTKIVVYNTVKAYSFAEFSTNNRELARSHKTGSFTEKEVAALNDKDETTLRDVFNSMTVSAKNTTSGDPVLSFILDKKLATKENYQKLIRIEVNGKGVHQVQYAQLQNLMINPFRIKRMPISNLKKSLLKFKIHLREKGEHKKESRKMMKAYYNPYTSDDTQSSFFRK